MGALLPCPEEHAANRPCGPFAFVSPSIPTLTHLPSPAPSLFPTLLLELVAAMPSRFTVTPAAQ